MSDEAGNASYRVALPEFEGPLDLLLHLCKTNEIDVVNLPVSFITQKYLEYLDVMKSLSVDVAADYLVMAATLAYLKARELVPTPEPLAVEDENGDEVLDPREELIRRLLEYRKYKDAAEQLGGRPIEGRNVFGRGMPIEADSAAGPIPFAEHSVWKLIEAFGKLLQKAGPKITHDVLFDRVSISARINQVIDRLENGKGSFRFDALFDLNLPEAELRSQLVVTLLAILELARLKVVRVLASEDQETLFIAQVQGAALADARRAQVTSDEEGLAAAESASEADHQEPAAAAGPDAPGESAPSVEEADATVAQAIASAQLAEAAADQAISSAVEAEAASDEALASGAEAEEGAATAAAEAAAVAAEDAIQSAQVAEAAADEAIASAVESHKESHEET